MTIVTVISHLFPAINFKTDESLPFLISCGEIFTRPKGVPGIYKLPGVVFFLLRLSLHPPSPPAFQIGYDFVQKWYVFLFFSFFVSQDLHATSRLVLRHTICLLCSCIVNRICKVFTLTHVWLDLQETLHGNASVSWHRGTVLWG